MPTYSTQDERTRASSEGASIGAGLSHKTPFYYDVLQRGLASIIADVDLQTAARKNQRPSEECQQALEHYEAVKLECLSVIDMARRFATLAEETATDPSLSRERRAELIKIGAVCRRVPEHGARTFQEAIQSFWFVHFALYSTGTKLSCGRIDQYLLPFMRADFEAGTLTLPEAQELVDCLWLRFNDRAQICRENFFLSPDEVLSTDSATGRQGGVVIDRGPSEGLVGHRQRFSYATDAADAINHVPDLAVPTGIAGETGRSRAAAAAQPGALPWGAGAGLP